MNTTLKKTAIVLINLLLICPSCNKDDEEYAKNAIVGTWERIAYGMYTDAVVDDPKGDLFVYLSNGKTYSFIQNCMNCKNPPSDEYPNYYPTTPVKYKIKNNILIEGNPYRRYTYRFFENGEKLELIDDDWTPTAAPDPGTLFIGPYRVRIQIFKRIHK